METNEKITKEGIKSLVIIGITLIGLIGMWAVVGRLAYPKQPVENEVREFIENNHNLLIQVAENAVDETKWEGILLSEPVRTLIQDGKFVDISGDEDMVVFDRSDVENNELRRIIYCPGGNYVFTAPDEEMWMMTAQEADTQTWQPSDNTKHEAKVVRMSDVFWYEEIKLG